MKLSNNLVFLPLLVLASAPVSAQSIDRVGDFSKGTSGWRSVQIDKKVPATKFTAKSIAGVPAVEAYANKSMALFTRKISVDLNTTPVLCWRWRVSDALKTANIATKSGDDQAARIYIGVDLPSSALSFSTKAKLALARARGGNDVPDGVINYVWDNRFAVGTARNNIYTSQAKVIVMQSGGAQKNRWINERRNLASDIKAQFKTSSARISSLAISSDTDNTGETVTAAFADIHFVSAKGQCQFR